MKAGAAQEGGHEAQGRPLPGFSSHTIVPLTGEMLSGACALALRQFAENSGFLPGEGLSPLLGLAAQNAALLAFRGLLTQLRIPFATYCPNPLAASPGFGISLGGRPCVLAPCPEPIQNGQVFLDFPPGWMGHTRQPDVALVIFFFTRGSGSQVGAGTSARYVADLPPMWACPRRWESLEDLRLRFDGKGPGSLTLTGLDNDRTYRAQTAPSSAGKALVVGAGWHSLTALCTSERPACQLRITGPRPGEAARIAPRHWQDLLQPLAVCGFPGYASLAGLRRHFHRKRPVPLRSLEELFLRIRVWARTNPLERIANHPSL
jgi:hypothetical protein